MTYYAIGNRYEIKSQIATIILMLAGLQTRCLTSLVKGLDKNAIFLLAFEIAFLSISQVILPLVTSGG